MKPHSFAVTITPTHQVVDKTKRKRSLSHRVIQDIWISKRGIKRKPLNFVGQNTNAGRKRLLEMFHFLQKKNTDC